MPEPISKECTMCKRVLFVTAETFQRNRTKPDGRQSQCRACDFWAKSATWEQGWNRLKRAHMPPSRWSQEGYMAKLFSCGRVFVPEVNDSAPVCFWCGNAVNAWARASAKGGGGGHWMDRIDPSRGHEEENCRPSCIPCNVTRGRTNAMRWRERIKLLDADYRAAGYPFIQWDQEGAQDWKRVTILDLSAFVVPIAPVEDPQLHLFGGAP